MTQRGWAASLWSLGGASPTLAALGYICSPEEAGGLGPSGHHVLYPPLHLVPAASAALATRAPLSGEDPGLRPASWGSSCALGRGSEGGSPTPPFLSPVSAAASARMFLPVLSHCLPSPEIWRNRILVCAGPGAIGWPFASPGPSPSHPRSKGIGPRAPAAGVPWQGSQTACKPQGLWQGPPAPRPEPKGPHMPFWQGGQHSGRWGSTPTQRLSEPLDPNPAQHSAGGGAANPQCLQAPPPAAVCHPQTCLQTRVLPPGPLPRPHGRAPGDSHGHFLPWLSVCHRALSHTEGPTHLPATMQKSGCPEGRGNTGLGKARHPVQTGLRKGCPWAGPSQSHTASQPATPHLPEDKPTTGLPLPAARAGQRAQHSG